MTHTSEQESTPRGGGTQALDRATDLGLMRRVGGGYVFLHRTLLDYFAAGNKD